MDLVGFIGETQYSSGEVHLGECQAIAHARATPDQVEGLQLRSKMLSK